MSKEQDRKRVLRAAALERLKSKGIPATNDMIEEVSEIILDEAYAIAVPPKKNKPVHKN